MFLISNYIFGFFRNEKNREMAAKNARDRKEARTGIVPVVRGPIRGRPRVQWEVPEPKKSDKSTPPVDNVGSEHKIDWSRPMRVSSRPR